VSLFSVLVDIAARTASLETGLNRANEHLEHFGEQAREVGEKVKGALEFAGIALGLGEIIHKFDEFVEHAVAVEHASEKTGLAVEQFSRLEFAAKQAGVGTDQLTSGIEKFAKSAEAAASGSGKQAEAFAAIGVKVKDSTGHLKPMNDLLSEVADKFESYKDSAEKTALAQALFGKAGADLIPLLNEGSKGIKEYSDRLDELGGTLSEKDTAKAEEFHHKLNELQTVLGGLWKSLVTEILPTLTNVASAFVDAGKGANDFNQKSSALITGLKVIVDAGYSVYKTFADIGNAIGALAAIMVSPFSQTKQIWADYQKQAEESEKRGNEFLKKLWAESGSGLDELAPKAESAAGKMAAPIIAKAFDMKEAIAEALAEMDKATRSNFDGAKSVDLGNTAAKEAIRELEALDKQFIKSREASQNMYDQMRVFGDQAARNMETSLATFLFDPFHKGIKGMLVDFIDIVRKMIAEAMAADILKKLFGTALDNKGGGSGLGGMFASFLIGPTGAAAAPAAASSGAFGHASGGRPTIGRPNLVGENGPELFIPDQGGTIVPNGAGGGGNLHFAPVYNINAPNGDAQLRAALPTLLAEAASKAKRDVLDAFQRQGYGGPRTA
jgi:hypothetical protein